MELYENWCLEQFNSKRLRMIEFVPSRSQGEGLRRIVYMKTVGSRVSECVGDDDDNIVHSSCCQCPLLTLHSATTPW